MNENNIYEDNNQEVQYTEATETTLNGQVYDNFNYENTDSGKGQSSGFGIVSLICGILSIILCCVPVLPIILGVVAIVTAIIQMVKSEKKGLAIAGIICAVFGIIFGIFGTLTWVGMGMAMDAFTSEEFLNQMMMYEEMGY